MQDVLDYLKRKKAENIKTTTMDYGRTAIDFLYRDYYVYILMAERTCVLHVFLKDADGLLRSRTGVNFVLERDELLPFLKRLLRMPLDALKKQEDEKILNGITSICDGLAARSKKSKEEDA